MNLEEEQFDFWYYGNRFAVNVAIYIYLVLGLGAIVGAIVLLVKNYYILAISCFVGAFFLLLLTWVLFSLKKTQIIVDCLIKKVTNLPKENIGQNRITSKE